jgi:hypothetical protein
MSNIIRQNDAKDANVVSGGNPDIRSICYDPTLIAKSKTFHIQIISAILEAQAIIADFGKI